MTQQVSQAENVNVPHTLDPEWRVFIVKLNESLQEPKHVLRFGSKGRETVDVQHIN